MESTRGIVFEKVVVIHSGLESVIILLTVKFHIISVALNVNFYAQCGQCKFPRGNGLKPIGEGYPQNTKNGIH